MGKYFTTLTFCLTLLITGCYGNAMLKFDWTPTQTAARHYPMTIISGMLYYPDKGGVPVPSDGVIHKSGWGKSVSVYVVGAELKPVPEKLEITYFSYTENTFYSGAFSLPYDKMVNLFEKGYQSTRRKGHVTYDEIMVGVAPGGYVAVWLIGLDRITEVFFGQAEPVDYAWENFVKNRNFTRDEFVKRVVGRNVPDELQQSVKKDGVDLTQWPRFREQYPWQPYFYSHTPPKDSIDVLFFNGEQDYFYYPLSEELQAQSRPIPSRMDFRHAGKLYFINFDQHEMLDAFEQLGKDETIYLDIVPNYPVENVNIRLRTESEAIVLEKFRMNDREAMKHR